jgi:MYXO-CTERM domain-containing protein
MFLGLRAATGYAASSYDCAAAALSATRRHGQAWLVEHEADQDLAADLVLVDQFLANLAERGASADRGLAGCPQLGTDEIPWGDDMVVHDHMACSSGRASSGWLAAVLGALLVVRRRRRR